MDKETLVYQNKCSLHIVKKTSWAINAHGYLIDSYLYIRPGLSSVLLSCKSSNLLVFPVIVTSLFSPFTSHHRLPCMASGFLESFRGVCEFMVEGVYLFFVHCHLFQSVSVRILPVYILHQNLLLMMHR